MLACFPDYGKAQPEYVAAITETFEIYSEYVQAQLAHPVHGLPSKFDYIPTVRQVQAEAGIILAEMHARLKPPELIEREIPIDEQVRVKQGLKGLVIQLKSMKIVEPTPPHAISKQAPLVTPEMKQELARIGEAFADVNEKLKSNHPLKSPMEQGAGTPNH